MDHSAEFVVEEEKVADATGRDGDTGAKKAEAAQVQANFQAAKAQDEKQRLAQRQKQVDFGKNTIGYQRYIQQVPKHRRRFRDPATPDIHKDVSKRSFEGQVRQGLAYVCCLRSVETHVQRAVLRSLAMQETCSERDHPSGDNPSKMYVHVSIKDKSRALQPILSIGFRFELEIAAHYRLLPL
eukprot:1150692-Pelagomonas_calceolata.AAC.1